MKKGMSLMELLLVVVLLGILAAMALPSHSKHIEKNRAREAEANLIVIYNAQKRYRLDNDVYYVCAPNCTIDNINENLTLNIADTYFNYSVSSYGPDESGFIATATRKDRDCRDKVMNLTDRGGPVQKECLTWQ